MQRSGLAGHISGEVKGKETKKWPSKRNGASLRRKKSTSDQFQKKVHALAKALGVSGLLLAKACSWGTEPLGLRKALETTRETAAWLYN